MSRASFLIHLQEFRQRWCAAAPVWRAAFLATWCGVLFVGINWRNYIIDYVPLALVPVAVYRDGGVNLDTYREYARGLPPGQQFTFVEAGGHLYPMKPLFVSLLASPAYLPPILAGVSTANIEFWIGWGRLVNGFLTGWAVGLCYLLARRYTHEAASLGLSLALAFGTGVWTMVGHCLNYHTGAMLCVAGLLVTLERFPLSPRRAMLAGFLIGAAIGMRPTTVVLLFPVGFYLLFLSNAFPTWRIRFFSLTGLIIIPVANMAMNWALFGNPLSTGYSPQEVDRWTTPFWTGFTGILIAPNSGLLPQSPFLVIVFMGIQAAFRQRKSPFKGIVLAGAAGFLAYWLLFARWHDWQGGLAFASRMLSEGYPLLVPLMAIGWNRIRDRRTARILAGVAVLWAVLYQIIGIATFDAITGDDPFHHPWTLRDHFYAVYANKFGLVALLLATIRTLLLFLISVPVVAIAIAPFLLRAPRDSLRESPLLHHELLAPAV